MRSTESAAIHVLRGIEEEGAKRRAAEVVVYASPPVALYILNHKRERLGEIEARYGMRVICLGDEGQMPSQFRIERVRAQVVVRGADGDHPGGDRAVAGNRGVAGCQSSKARRTQSRTPLRS